MVDFNDVIIFFLLNLDIQSRIARLVGWVDPVLE